MKLVPSKKVHSILKSKFGDWFNANGFSAGNCVSCWKRPEGNKYLVLWFQIWHSFDRWTGGQFTLGFQWSDDQDFDSPTPFHARFWSLLDEPTKSRIVEYQNVVIKTLPSPNQYMLNVIFLGHEGLYLRQFKQVDIYPSDKDIWLRYSHPEHIEHLGGSFCCP